MGVSLGVCGGVGVCGGWWLRRFFLPFKHKYRMRSNLLAQRYENSHNGLYIDLIGYEDLRFGLSTSIELSASTDKHLRVPRRNPPVAKTTHNA